MIPLSKPSMSSDVINVIKDIIHSGRLAMGPWVKRFEDEFKERLGVKFAVAVNSGTSALHLCIRAIGIQPGDEVITTPFSFVSSSNCILFEKGRPVFVDVDEESFNIDPDKIEPAISHRTKAILPVHIFGQSCNMEKIMEIAEKRNLRVIEDACESLMATHYRRYTGTFGDCGTFGFYPNKQITTGEGGMVVTNNEKFYMLIKSMANQGRGNNSQWLVHERLGYNYRMPEISAALGVSQFSRIDEILKKRQAAAEYYKRKLSGIPGIKLPKTVPGNTHSWFVFPIRVSENIRDKLIESLKDKGIQTKAYFYPPIHLQPFYRKMFGFKEGDFPIAEKLSKTTLILPFYTDITEKEITEVASILKKLMVELNG